MLALLARRLTGWLRRAPSSTSPGAFSHLSALAGSPSSLSRLSALRPATLLCGAARGKDNTRCWSR